MHIVERNTVPANCVLPPPATTGKHACRPLPQDVVRVADRDQGAKQTGSAAMTWAACAVLSAAAAGTSSSRIGIFFKWICTSYNPSLKTLPTHRAAISASINGNRFEMLPVASSKMTHREMVMRAMPPRPAAAPTSAYVPASANVPDCASNRWRRCPTSLPRAAPPNSEGTNKPEGTQYHRSGRHIRNKVRRR